VIVALVIVGLFAVLGCSYLFAVMCVPIESRSKDRLSTTITMWLADERPAWETIEAFERDVERVLRGQVWRPLGMPLRPPSKPSDAGRSARPTEGARRDADGWASVRRTSQGTVYKT
jgi:hypothetical protein